MENEHTAETAAEAYDKMTYEERCELARLNAADGSDDIQDATSRIVDGWHDLRKDPKDLPKDLPKDGATFQKVAHRVVYTTDGHVVQRCCYCNPWGDYKGFWRMHNGQEPAIPIIGWCEQVYPGIPEHLRLEEE